MGKLSITVAFVLAAGFAAAASAQTQPRPAPGGAEGFFRPSADPALTAIRPAPANGKTRPAAEEIRKAEEAQMDRVEVEHAIAKAEVVTKAPAITSPLDGTAPILSPLDGTAPIISPVSR
jgi:hypothetical protein